MKMFIRQFITFTCALSVGASSVAFADSSHVRGGSIPGTGTTDTDDSGAPPAGGPVIDGRTFPNERFAVSKYEISIDASRAVNLLVTIRGEKQHSVKISRSGVVKKLLWYNDFPYIIDDDNHLFALNLDRLEAFRLKFSWSGVFREGVRPSLILSLLAAGAAGLKQAVYSTVSHYDVVVEACGAMAVTVFCTQALIRGLINNYHALGHGDDLFTKKVMRSRFRPYVIGDINKITYSPTGEVDKLPIHQTFSGLGREEKMISMGTVVRRPRNGRTCRQYLERYSRF